jgi:hypothetical protein
MESPMPYLKWFTPSRRNYIVLTIHLLFLALSLLYLAGAFYMYQNQHSGSYAVKILMKRIDVFIIDNFHMLLILIPVLSACMIYFTSNLELKIAIIFILFISMSNFAPESAIANLPGFDPLQSLYLERQSYHLSYYSDVSGTGYYELYECDSLGIACQVINSYELNGFNSSQAQVKLEPDEASRKLSVKIDGKQVDLVSIP